MANLIRVEPSLFNADEAWFVFDDGRKCLRKIRTEEKTSSDFPAPMILRDGFNAPVQSMANGKWYDSKSGLNASYRPDGNPQGIRYECVGNEDTTKFEKPKRDQERSIAAIDRAASELGFNL